MNLLRQIYQDNTPEHWLIALLAVTCSMAIFELLRRLIRRRLQRMDRPDNVLGQFAIEIITATRVLLSGAIGVYVAVHFLNLPAAAEKIADRTFAFLVLLQVGFWASRGLDFWLRRRFTPDDAPDKARSTTHTLLNFVGRLFLWSLVGLLILDNLGFNVTTLIASLGIGGVAVALAVQNILGDIFASLSIAIDKPFVIGDYIIVDDLMGTVEHVGLKTTRMRSLNGEQIIFSNNDLLKSRIRNYKRMEERRAVFSVGVTYDTPHELLQKIPEFIQQAVETQGEVRFDRAHFQKFGASSLDFECAYYILSAEYRRYMDVQQAINLQLVRVFKEHGIEFAFPTQTVHLGGRLALQPEGTGTRA